MDASLRKQLKKQAFSLKPVVLLGQKGLTDAVHQEINTALNSHELIKIKLAGLERDEMAPVIESIVQKSQAEQVTCIGRILTIYRPKSDS